MKNKLINTLMLAGIIATTLVGCNSGASGNVNNQASTTQTASNTTNTNAETLDSAPIGSISSVLMDFASATLNEYIDDTVGKVVWNLISGGSISGNSGQATQQTLNAINQELNHVEDTLAQQNAVLQTTYNVIESTALGSTGTAISKITETLVDNNNDTSDWITKATSGLGQQNVSIAEGIFGGYSQAQMNESISLALLQNQSSLFSSNPKIAGTQDSYEQFLSCDENNSTVTYDATNLSLTQQEHPQSSLLQNNCAVANFLNDAINQYGITQLTQGSNIFYTTQGFDQALDLVYLKILNAMTEAYAVDQVRLYLGLPVTNPSGSINIQAPIVIPNSAYNNYALAESDLALAYNMRLANLQQLFASAKSQLFNQFAGALVSTTMTSQCNLSYQGIDAESTITMDSNGNNPYSWDGTTLKASCKENNGNAISITYNVGDLCTINTGSNPISTVGEAGHYSYPNMTVNPNNYNLYVFNGAVSCGTQNWKTTIFNSNNVTPDTDIISSELQSANIGRATGQNAWNGILSWDNYLPIASPVTSSTAQVSFGDGNNTAAAYNQDGDYNQSISISGLTTGYTQVSQVTGGMLIFDGAHAYMAVVYDNSLHDTYVGIQCLPNDNSCTMGTSGNSGYSLSFTNGDSINIRNNGGTGTNYEDTSNPWYWITPSYAVVPGPYLPQYVPHPGT
ncbi:hypothetical protein [Aquella oligotrophica]|uniref:Uncharacterized protein n=1 Tax=Aquella oligotrophica TaxID=2067065 RepID=A0A2I7N4T7_9NEIS|nr:hypothetical protein [Aquella oligotrophica]AUR51448.1 hypothetical protein CUN60_03805 [Aquella oligotrophica]